MHRSWIRFVVAIAVQLVMAVGGSRAAVFDILAYGAVPNDGGDDAPALRAAYAAAVAAGGGTVYIPSGRFDLATPDPASAATHILVTASGIRFAGDARGSHGGGEFGSILRSTTSTLHVFAVVTPAAPAHVNSPAGVAFEHLQISRANFSYESLGVNAVCGILFDTVDNRETWQPRVLMQDCRVANHFDGIRSRLSSTTVYARPFFFKIDNSEIADNARHGMFLSCWGELKITNTEFWSNGDVRTGTPSAISAGYGHGLYLLAYKHYHGTVTAVGCSFTGNGLNGFSIQGVGQDTVPESNPPVVQDVYAQDVMVSASQFDANGGFGVGMYRVNNVQLVGCLISANGALASVNGAGLYAAYVNQASISGTTFLSNREQGALFDVCTGIALAGCQFTYNNNVSAGASYALMISAVTNMSVAGVGFNGTVRQTRAILMQNNPVGVIMQGVSIDAGTVTKVGTWNIGAAAEYLIDYFDGASIVRVQDP